MSVLQRSLYKHVVIALDWDGAGLSEYFTELGNELYSEVVVDENIRF